MVNSGSAFIYLEFTNAPSKRKLREEKLQKTIAAIHARFSSFFLSTIPQSTRKYASKGNQTYMGIFFLLPNVYVS